MLKFNWQETAALRKQVQKLQAALEASKKRSKPNPKTMVTSDTKTPSSRKRPAPISPLPPPHFSDAEEDDDEEEAANASDPCPSDSDGRDASPEEISSPAKNNRLRRLCERKPSGRCKVPDWVHEQWVKGGPERLALREQLEAVDWDKDCGRVRLESESAIVQLCEIFQS